MIENLDMLLNGTLETLYMSLTSVVFAYLLGLPLGVLVVSTAPHGIHPNRRLHTILGWIIDIGRSIPFIILIVDLFPLTRAIVGKIIGPTAAVVPLVVAATPFVARMVETSLEEVDQGVVEAARTMGATGWEIICKVLLPESVPSLLRGMSITTITLIGYSAMAGAIGSGGLGDIAIRYGMHRYDGAMMNITLVLIIVIVAVIQLGFNRTAARVDRRLR